MFVRSDSFEILSLSALVKQYAAEFAGSNKHSIRAKFRYDLPYFLRFLQYREKLCEPTLADLTRGRIEAFVDYRLDFESPASVARRLACGEYEKEK